MKHGKPWTPCCPDEDWRCCIESHDYWISSCGRILLRDGTLKTLAARTDGYVHTCLWDGQRMSAHYVHRLVCRAFYGRAPEDKPCTAHNDGNRSNNHARNLRWASYEENEADKALHGTRKRGIKHRLGKFDFDTICRIREDYKTGIVQMAIANKYGITQSHVSRIIRNEIRTEE